MLWKFVNILIWTNLGCDVFFTPFARDILLIETYEGVGSRSTRSVARRNSTGETEIVSFHVQSSITARYVSTSVATSIRNLANDSSKEVTFVFRLSNGAFISSFSLTIDGVVYQSRVKEKEKAQKEYNEAKNRGQTTAQVKQKEKDARHFAVDVNVAADKTVKFHLTFQELLRRNDGVFTHKINISPGEIVENLTASVHIIEPQGIRFVNVSWNQESTPEDGTSNLTILPMLTKSGRKRARVVMRPTYEKQKGMSSKGLNGDLVVMYDVEHNQGAGDIQIVNGYFVHYISPEGLPVTRKNIIFVIDVSGSMSSSGKLDQTKAGMSTILDDIRGIDRFNIIPFSEGTNHWRSGLVEATPENKEAAKVYINNLSAGGSTNIHMALQEAAEQFELFEVDRPSAFSMIILLTDGVPTTGITDSKSLTSNIASLIDEKYALFTIGFGNDVDAKLLEQLALENQGLYRKIYVDSSSALQLKGFYDEVATPLLFNVAVSYDENVVDVNTLTQNNFISYFDGKELLVAGKLADNFSGNALNAVLAGNSFDARLEWQSSKEIEEEPDSVLNSEMVGNFTERMWAYMTIKNLMQRSKYTKTKEEKDSMTQQALDLSLKYSFVTPLTSLLVVLPEGNHTQIEKADAELEAENVQTAPLAHHYLSVPQNVGGIRRFRPYVGLQQGGRPRWGSYRQLPHGGTQRQGSTPRWGSGGQTPQGGAQRQGSTPRWGSGVYSDPHFIIEVPGNDIAVCFDFQGENGSVAKIIEDPSLDFLLTGKMVPSEKVEKLNASTKHPPSFFGEISISFGRYRADITRGHIYTSNHLNLTWTSQMSVDLDDWTLIICNKTRLLLQRGKSVEILVIRHIVKVGAHDHFDVFVKKSEGFSSEAAGLIGEFLHKPITLVSLSEHMESDKKLHATIRIRDKLVTAVQRWRNIARDRVNVPCWFSKPSKFLDKNIADYFIQ